MAREKQQYGAAGHSRPSPSFLRATGRRRRRLPAGPTPGTSNTAGDEATGQGRLGRDSGPAPATGAAAAAPALAPQPPRARPRTHAAAPLLSAPPLPAPRPPQGTRRRRRGASAGIGGPGARQRCCGEAGGG